MESGAKGETIPDDLALCNISTFDDIVLRGGRIDEKNVEQGTLDDEQVVVQSLPVTGQSVLVVSFSLKVKEFQSFRS